MAIYNTKFSLETDYSIGTIMENSFTSHSSLGRALGMYDKVEETMSYIPVEINGYGYIKSFYVRGVTATMTVSYNSYGAPRYASTKEYSPYNIRAQFKMKDGTFSKIVTYENTADDLMVRIDVPHNTEYLIIYRDGAKILDDTRVKKHLIAMNSFDHNIEGVVTYQHTSNYSESDYRLNKSVTANIIRNYSDYVDINDRSKGKKLSDSFISTFFQNQDSRRLYVFQNMIREFMEYEFSYYNYSSVRQFYLPLDMYNGTVVTQEQMKILVAANLDPALYARKIGDKFTSARSPYDLSSPLIQPSVFSVITMPAEPPEVMPDYEWDDVPYEIQPNYAYVITEDKVRSINSTSNRNATATLLTNSYVQSIASETKALPAFHKVATSFLNKTESAAIASSIKSESVSSIVSAIKSEAERTSERDFAVSSSIQHIDTTSESGKNRDVFINSSILPANSASQRQISAYISSRTVLEPITTNVEIVNQALIPEQIDVYVQSSMSLVQSNSEQTTIIYISPIEEWKNRLRVKREDTSKDELIQYYLEDALDFAERTCNQRFDPIPPTVKKVMTLYMAQELYGSNFTLSESIGGMSQTFESSEQRDKHLISILRKAGLLRLRFIGRRN